MPVVRTWSQEEGVTGILSTKIQSKTLDCVGGLDKEILAATCAGDDGLPIRREGEIEDPHGVAGQGGQLRHAGLLPHDDLILAVAVGAHDLVDVLGPCQVADLGGHSALGFNP